MRNSKEYGARLKSLCNRLRRAGGKSPKLEPNGPLDELVLGCLSAHTTESRARTAFNKLRSNFVDFNELRVCREEEIAEILGKGFHQSKETAKQITMLLQAIFAANNCLDINCLLDGGKREARSFLESLDGITAYVLGRVMLRSLEAHAFPVNDQILLMLREEEVVSADADAANVQGFLERQISASDMGSTYALLCRHADGFKASHGKGAKTKKAKKTKKKVATKKKSKKQA